MTALWWVLGVLVGKTDAERYRWLRDEARSVDWTADLPNRRMQYTIHCRCGPQGMDASIDAVRSTK